MKVLLITLACGLISMATGCCRQCVSETNRVFDEVARVHGESLYQKYGLRRNMTGGGGSDGKYTKLDIGFIIRGTLTIEEARRIMVEGITEFLTLVNSEEMTPFLSNPPLEEDRIQYAIRAVDENGLMSRFLNGFTLNNQISYVSICKGVIYYAIAKKRGEPLENVHKETFEEAKKIIECENLG